MTQPLKAEQVIINALRELRATGPDGFEGLVRDLLTKLTGREIRLAKAGPQAGRDMSTGRAAELVIAVECKRFNYDSRLDDRALLGELAQVSRSLDPEVWVLAASTEVSEQTIEQLLPEADEKGLELLVLDCSERGGPLLALCAAYPEISAPALLCRSPGEVLACLDALRARPDHLQLLLKVSHALSPADVGFAAAADSLRNQFLVAQTNRERSRDYFGQQTLSRDHGALIVPRTELLANLDAWKASWTGSREILVLEGEEGTGKTWSLACWLTGQYSEHGDSPVLLWLSAQRFDFESIESVALSSLKKAFLQRSERFLQRRLRAWAEASSSAPRVVLVIDGMNERANRAKWQEWLFQTRLALPRLPGLALILTTRSSFLRDVESNYSDAGYGIASNDSSVRENTSLRRVQVENFTSAEVKYALRSSGLEQANLRGEVEDLLRRPRYLALAIRRWPALLESGDFTRERLFFEEWRDRAASRIKQDLSPAGYQQILVAAARVSKASPGKALTYGDLAKQMPQVDKWQEQLDDLISHGVFQPVPGVPGRLQLSRDRLYLGLGLSLLEEASLAAVGGIDEAIEAVDRALEPAGDTADLAPIVGNAVCAALLSSGPAAAPIEARVAVLLALAQQRNGADAWQQAGPWRYFLDNPEVFAEAARLEWNRRHFSSEARERLTHCYACVAEFRPAAPHLIAQVEHWLGSANPAGARPLGAPDGFDISGKVELFPGRLDEARKAVATLQLPAKLVDIPSHPLALANLALLVMSHGPLEKYTPAITSWALSRAVMGVAWENSEMAWLLRFAPRPVVESLRSVANQLAQVASDTALRAAANLFWACGSPNDVKEARRLAPTEPWPDSGPFKDIQAALDASSAGATPKALARRLEPLALDFDVDFSDLVACNLQSVLEDLEPGDLGGQMRTIGRGTFDSAEAALSRIDPFALAKFFRSAVRAQLANLHKLTTSPYLLENGFLILTPDDLDKVQALQAGLQETPLPIGNDPEHHLATVSLANLESAEDQLNFLLSRRSDFDNRDWSGIIGDLPPEATRRAVNQLGSATGVARRRLLWFGWQEPIVLDDEDRKVIRAAAIDTEVGTVSVLPSQHGRDPELLVQAVEDGHYDDELLSHLLMHASWELEALKANSQRVERLLGHAAKSWLVTSSDEVRAWAQTMDSDLRTNPSTWEMGSDGHYSRQTLEKTLDTESATTDFWIGSVLGGSPLGMELSQRRPGLLESLAIGLLNRNDARGVEIVKTLLSPSALSIRQVDGKSQVPITTFWPFEANDTAATRTLIRWFIEQAVTNDELQQIAYAARLFNRAPLLHDVAWQEAELSELGRARALTLDALGASGSEALGALDHRLATESTWVVWAADHARIELRRELQARHWFREFLRAPSREWSWAAFRLFLASVDRRFWLWKHQELEEARSLPDFQMRSRHLVLNRHELERRIEARMKERKERLFAWKIPSTDMLPWKRSWSLS